MHMNRREFLQLLAAASATGFALNSKFALAGTRCDSFMMCPNW